MHFHRLNRKQKGLLKNITNFSNLGCYEVVGSTIIQQHTYRHSDMQWSMHLHSFAHTCTYAAFTRYANKQINIENIMHGPYIYFQGLIYAYILYIYIYI